MLDEEPAPINDRIVTMRLPPQWKVYATFYSVYALTMTNTEETKEEFHSDCMRHSGVYRLMTGWSSLGILMLELV